MKTRTKVVLLEIWLVLVFPVLGFGLMLWLGPLVGGFLCCFLFLMWCWEMFAFAHYRYCRQEELLHVLNTAAATKAPIEAVLTAHLKDRPHSSWYRFWSGSLMLFVFPGFYPIHRRRCFDKRVELVTLLLEKGVPLDQAFTMVPGVVSQETALAVTVGQFTGKLPQALLQLPGKRQAPAWLEIVPRLLYPLILLQVTLSVVTFITIFITPTFEDLFAAFHLRLPIATSVVSETVRWFMKWSAVPSLIWLLLLIGFNVGLFSSRAKWYAPIFGRLYRMHVRGQFLQTLGLMMGAGKPLPQILGSTLESGLLPGVLEQRVGLLADDLEQGQPLPASLTRHGLITRSMSGLIAAAEKTQSLPWALEELGDSLARRCARLTYRLGLVVFPLSVFACACLVAFVSVAMFAPLVALLKGIRD